MQFERAAIDLLIVFASSRRIPSLPVFERRSEPARSTTVNSAFLKNFFLTGGGPLSASVSVVRLGYVFYVFIPRLLIMSDLFGTGDA